MRKPIIRKAWIQYVPTEALAEVKRIAGPQVEVALIREFGQGGFYHFAAYA